MSNEIKAGWQTAKTLDRYITNRSKQWWNGSGFEPYNASNWTTYASSLTEQGSTGEYWGTFPTAIVTQGEYLLTIRERQSGTAAVTDPIVGEGSIDWNGSSQISLSSIVGNQSIEIVTTNPVADNVTISIFKGDDYLAVDGRALLWTTADASQWNDLTAATVTFTATKSSSNDATGDASLTKSVTVNQATGANKQVQVELTSSDTDSLAVWFSGYDYEIKATLSNASIVTLVTGTMTVKP